MNRVKSDFLKFCSLPSFPLILLGIAFAILHLFLPVTLADDAWFAQILAGDKATFSNWFRFLCERYEFWSSRTAIEGLLILVARFPWLWRVTDTFVCISITVLLSRMFNPENSREKNLLLCALWVTFPVCLTGEAGFLATTLNYTWPLCAVLLTLTPMVKQFQGRPVKKWEYAVALPALLFACFQELLCATFLLAVLGSLAYRVFLEKKNPAFQITCALISIVMLIFTLTCPGNNNRTLLETASWFPEYADFSLFKKVEIGFSSMMKAMFLRPNSFVLIFCAVLAVAVWMKSEKRRRAIPAVFPLLYGIFYGVLGFGEDMVGKMGTGFILSSPLTWFPDIIFVLLLALILLSLRFVIEDTKQYCFLFFLLFLGAASRMAMGLSPTVWASGNRSCLFLYLTMSVVMGALIIEIARKMKAMKEQ